MKKFTELNQYAEKKVYTIRETIEQCLKNNLSIQSTVTTEDSLTESHIDGEEYVALVIERYLADLCEKVRYNTSISMNESYVTGKNTVTSVREKEFYTVDLALVSNEDAVKEQLEFGNGRVEAITIGDTVQIYGAGTDQYMFTQVNVPVEALNKI